MQEEENVGHVEALTISNGTAPKEKESLEDSKAKENWEKDSKEEKEEKEAKEKGASTAETYGITQENAHTQKEKGKEHPSTNSLKETINQKKKSQQ